MSEKPITPYARLLKRAQKFASAIKYAHRRTMWVYPRGQLNDRWPLGDLFERTKAADQLGYDVRVVAAEDGLRVEYVKRPDVPIEWA